MYNSLDFLKDFLILPGGSDINPAIYDKENYKSHISDYSIERDKNEIEQYNKAVKEGRCIYGICRGLQLISALNGLTLIQNMSHKGNHYINVRNIETNQFDKQIYVNNAHHQLVWTENKLEDENYIVYGWCKLSDYYHYQEGVQLDVQIEPEIIYFPKVKALATQFHPEWMSKSNPKDLQTLTYIEELVNKLF